MKDSFLTKKQKSFIESALVKQDYKKIVGILDSISTKHSGTAKMKDKRYVIAEIAKHIAGLKLKDFSRKFFITGMKILSIKSDNAKEIGIHILWRGYKHNRKTVLQWLYKITDDNNWEVREFAAGALGNLTSAHPDFYNILKRWSKDKRENIRRGVVLAAAALRNRKDSSSTVKAFALLEPLLYDSSAYVKKNLGPFILGSYFGNAFPNELFKFLDRIIKIDNAHVRWNAAMVFNNSFGNRYPNEALKYLKLLSKDTRSVVQRAVKSTLNHLRKRHKNIKL
ncbi:MAG: HEAT repeat domain-containing protein [Ignavibacteria bacterium]|nr:HEAT repeat domain-containing protein [Ignavibacteria bacterium]